MQIVRTISRWPITRRGIAGGIVAIAAAALMSTSAEAQKLSGRVTDQDGAPLTGVTISIPAIHRGAISNSDGRFTIEGIPAGIYTVEFHSIGYRKETRSITMSDDDQVLMVSLATSPLEFNTVTVTAKPQASDLLTTPQSVAVVGGRELDRERGQTVTESLLRVPGVTTYSTGSAIAKPVIRGLTAQRVLVLTDGVRQEGQQWGDEHGPEIDALDVDRIEVVRGPNSVLYGSDALGGVINIIRPEVPASEHGAPELAGNLLLNAFSNNDQGAGAISLHGASGKVGYRGNFSLRSASNYTTPEGMVSNSGEDELNGSALVGIRDTWGSIGVDYSHFGEKLQIHDEEPEATAYQKVMHDKVHLHTTFRIPSVRLDMNAGWQRNNRLEFEERDAAEPVLDLVLKTLTLDIKGHHDPIGPLYGTVGLAVMSQDNASLAEEKLIPDFKSLDLAGFLYEEASFGDFTLSAGVRFDSRRLDVATSEALGIPEQQRDYTAISGTAGLVWRAAEPLSFALNLGRGWRAPTPFELFSDGVHEGSARYEIGSTTLRPEASLNIDLAARVATSRVQGEITGFRNIIDPFIFLSATGEIDSASGFPIFYNRQARATLTGADFGLQAHVTDWLVMNAGASFVRGMNEETESNLPLMPADRYTIGARFIQESLGFLDNPYLSFGVRIVADQNRVDSHEATTPGYTLFNAGLGAEIPVNGHSAHVDLTVENLANKAYRDHLSRLKRFVLNPGRDIVLKVSIPFNLVH